MDAPEILIGSCGYGPNMRLSFSQVRDRSDIHSLHLSSIFGFWVVGFSNIVLWRYQWLYAKGDWVFALKVRESAARHIRNFEIVNHSA